MDHTNLIENLDIDLFFMSLSEKGGHGSHLHGSIDTGIGDRAIAAQTRIGGADQFEHITSVLQDALRSAGWSNAPITASIDDGKHDANMGRKWSLRNAIATAVLTTDIGEDADISKVRDILLASRVPDDSIDVTKTDKNLIVTLRYLSDGHGADAISEMKDQLTKIGINVR
jgi:hypothetical protein